MTVPASSALAVGPSRGPFAEQARQLAARVAASGIYLHEPAQFARACAAHPQIVERLGVVSDHGSLTTPESRNLVRDVVLTDGSRAVLKIIGSAVEYGEGEVLSAWHALGLPCVEPLAWGYLRSGDRGQTGTVTYLLTAYREGRPLRPRTGDPRRQIGDLVRFIRQFHASGAQVRAARSWQQRMQPHLEQVLPVIRAAGVREPVAWQEVLARLSHDGRTVLHGDPAGSNVLITPEGLVLLDPPGSLVGMREADAGQVCWHVGGADGLDDAVEAACSADPTLIPDAVAAFAGFNLLLAAGYELSNHAALDRVPDDATRDERIDRAQHLLDGAEHLIGQAR